MAVFSKSGPAQGLFFAHFRSFCNLLSQKMLPKWTKNVKHEIRKMQKTIHIPRHDKFHFLGCYGPAFSEIQWIPRYGRQTLHIWLFRDPSLQAPKNIETWRNNASRNIQKSGKIHARKNTDFGHWFGVDFDFKHVPKMTPTSSKGTLGLSGNYFGEPGEPPRSPPDASRPI